MRPSLCNYGFLKYTKKIPRCTKIFYQCCQKSYEEVNLKRQIQNAKIKPFIITLILHITSTPMLMLYTSYQRKLLRNTRNSFNFLFCLHMRVKINFANAVKLPKNFTFKAKARIQLSAQSTDFVGSLQLMYR